MPWFSGRVPWAPVVAGGCLERRLPVRSGDHEGALVDAGVARLAQLGPRASLAAQESSPEMLRLPDAFPHEVTGGPQDANQSAAQPCYLDRGVPPLSLTGGAPACLRRDQPEFDGTQSFYNSGVLMATGDSFTVPLATATKPGTYSLMCM